MATGAFRPIRHSRGFAFQGEIFIFNRVEGHPWLTPKWLSPNSTRSCLDGCETLKRPGYFLREVTNIGGIQTVRNLLAKHGTSDGFSTLLTLGRLDLKVEAFVLLPWSAVSTDLDRRQGKSVINRTVPQVGHRGLPRPPIPGSARHQDVGQSRRSQPASLGI